MLRYFLIFMSLYVCASAVVAQERRDLWCRYKNDAGKTVLEKKCDVVVIPSAGCKGKSILGDNYVLGFSERSKAIVLDGCVPDKPVQINGVESWPDSIDINGRRYFTASLRETGETFDFEPIISAEHELAPWSEEWKRYGVPGKCNDRGATGRDPTQCIKSEICTFLLAGGEGGCSWMFRSAKRELAKIDHIEDQYHLDDNLFSDTEILQAGSATCYPRDGRGNYLCFDPDTTSTSASSENQASKGGFEGPIFAGTAVFGLDNSMLVAFLEKHSREVVYLDIQVGYMQMSRPDIELGEECEDWYFLYGERMTWSNSRNDRYLNLGLTAPVNGKLTCGDFARMDLKYATTDAASTGTGVYIFPVSGFFDISRTGRWNDRKSYELRGVEADVASLQSARSRARALAKDK